MKKIIFGGGYTNNFTKFRASIQIIDLQLLTKDTFKIIDLDSLKKCCVRNCNSHEVIRLLHQSYILSASLPKLANEFNMHWIENITTIYIENSCNIEFAQCYLGGYLTDKSGVNRPIGTTSEETQNLVLNLKNLVCKMNFLSKITPLPTNTKELILDSFSAGLVFHEIVGHPSEQDVIAIDHNSLKSYSFVQELNAIDRPASGQRYDDFGHKMRPQDLSKDSLGERSGNCFLSFTKGDVKKPMLLNRQRCLMVKFKQRRPYLEANAIVCGGRYIPAEKSVLLIVVFAGLGRTALLIPLSDIRFVFGISNSEFKYYTICKKQGVPVVVGLNVLACRMTLRCKVENYIQRTSNEVIL